MAELEAIRHDWKQLVFTEVKMRSNTQVALITQFGETMGYPGYLKALECKAQ
jgi:hypothetical protein